MREMMMVGGTEIVVSGSFPRIARLRAEYYEWVDDLQRFVEEAKTAKLAADLITLLQRPNEGELLPGFVVEWDSIAALPIMTYEKWWTNQINDKTRNMVRKAQKSGVEVREVPFSDDLIRGIKGIYDEAPIRQGKPFTHYGKDLATLKREHISYLGRSQFIGAYHKDELIGFIKLVHDKDISHLMQIISKIGQRSKAPTNALLAKAVEMCAERHVRYLHYGVWSKRGLGDFKKHHAFERLDLPRYFVPLTVRGRALLAMKFHHRLLDRMPESWVDMAIGLRKWWNAHRLGADTVRGHEDRSGARG